MLTICVLLYALLLLDTGQPATPWLVFPGAPFTNMN